MKASELKIKLFADGASLDEMRAAHKTGIVEGFTTNPTLMRQAGIDDYEGFARAVLETITDMPISLEVFSDDFDEMVAQAREISRWGSNVNIKIPITNTKRESSAHIIKTLSDDGISLNVTAVFTPAQVAIAHDQLNPEVPAIVSVFAGRIADAGLDPVPIMREALGILRDRPKAELLWASPREVFNVVQADAIGVDIITLTNNLLGKLGKLGTDLEQFSLETVKMFYDDAKRARYAI